MAASTQCTCKNGTRPSSKPDILKNAIQIVQDAKGSASIGLQAEINTFDPNRSYTASDAQILTQQLKRLTGDYQAMEDKMSGLFEEKEFERKAKEAAEFELEQIAVKVSSDKITIVTETSNEGKKCSTVS